MELHNKSTIGDAPSLTAKERCYSDAEERWIAVRSRDKEADGAFFYGVRTTGVYCRPSCPSRPALRKNIFFYETCSDAEIAGYRPCKKCRPDESARPDPHTEVIAAACRMIESSVESLTLSALADAAGLSRYHFHRLFKKITGITPRAYGVAKRVDRFRDGLGVTPTVTQAIYNSGFNTSSRLYEQSDGLLGMTPSVYRKGGPGQLISFAVGDCSLGAVLVAATAKGISSIEFGTDADQLVKELQDRFPKALLHGGDAMFEAWVANVIGAVESPTQNLELPLDIRGTAFQQRVWLALRRIPFGQTASYADIAAMIGAPTAVRAVAGACAANKIAVAIPCHRVIRVDGNLSGYRWGVERKAKLLEREGVLLPMPT
jgi:AraC family transcriptional regulator of adaptative response/methylated-DNA-[protein]-cysteine methyltransferase